MARSVAALVLAVCAAAAPPAGVPPSSTTELAALEPADVEVPAWRDLWYGSLEALHREPSINNTQEDVVAQLGSLAFLHCPVRHLGERGVSWVRRRDWHIISSGVLMYTNDERFQVLHGEGSDDWILQIKYVQKRDNGTYECQVSTGSGTLSRLVHLHIAVPEAFILGADEHHVDAGSTINLVCIIEKVPRARGTVWSAPARSAPMLAAWCRVAEPGAAAVRVLVPQRAHDQLRRGARRHRAHGAGAQDAVGACHPGRGAASLRQLHVSRRQHGARAHLRLRVRGQRQDGGDAESQRVRHATCAPRRSPGGRRRAAGAGVAGAASRPPRRSPGGRRRAAGAGVAGASPRPAGDSPRRRPLGVVNPRRSQCARAAYNVTISAGNTRDERTCTCACRRRTSPLLATSSSTALSNCK